MLLTVLTSCNSCAPVFQSVLLFSSLCWMKAYTSDSYATISLSKSSSHSSVVALGSFRHFQTVLTSLVKQSSVILIFPRVIVIELIVENLDGESVFLLKSRDQSCQSSSTDRGTIGYEG